MFDIFHHIVKEHRANRDLATPSSPLREIKLWYIMSALPHSTDGMIKRRQRRFALLKSRDLVLLLPWLMAHTR